MHRAIVLAALPLAGCAQLFGIDNTTAATGSDDSLTIEHVSIGAAVSNGAQDLSGETASFLTGDSLTDVPAESTTPGVFTANVAGTPPILFTLPDAPMRAQHLWALGSRSMKGTLVAFEHASPSMPIPTSMLAFSVSMPTPYNGGQLDIYAVGAWMHHTLVGAELPGVGTSSITATVPYSMFTPTAGNPPARITSADVVLVLRYTGSQLTAVLQAMSFDQTANTDNITGAMNAITLDKTLSYPLPSDVATRFLAVRPAVGVPVTSWSINAAPGAMVGADTGVPLESGSATGSDTTVTVAYGDPFESLGWAAMFELRSTGTRTYMLNGSPISLTASLSTIVDASAMSAPPDAGLPNTIQVGDTQLNTDGQMLSVDPTAPVTISFLADQSTNTIYSAKLYELVMNGTPSQRQLIVDALSTTSYPPSFVLPAGTVQSGHTYVIQASCIQGMWPNAAAGDLQTTSFPVSEGTLDSGVFTVQ
jgi:hypothetical protein